MKVFPVPAGPLRMIRLCSSRSDTYRFTIAFGVKVSKANESTLLLCGKNINGHVGRTSK